MRMPAAFVLMALMISRAFADPVGDYKVEGFSPNKSPYSGTVRVEQTGDTYRVVWNIDGTVYVGTGIGNSDFIAVSYRSGNDTGLALYGQDGTGWKGVWTYAGARKVGSEAWVRK